MNLKRMKDDARDLIPPKLRKGVKRLLGKSPDKQVEPVTIRGSSWVSRKSKRLISKFGPSYHHIISSNIEMLHTASSISLAKDFFIDKTIRSGRYTFEYPLVLTDPYHAAPLTALVGFVTKHPYRVRCTIPSKSGARDFVTLTESKTIHRVPVIGLYPNQVNQITIELLTENDSVKDSITFPLKTSPLPGCLRNVVLVKKHTKDSAFPFTFVTGGATDYSYAFDDNGDIRYYLERTTKTYGLYLLSNGRFLQQSKNILEPTFSNPHSVVLNEMDYLGRTHKTFYVPNGTHHDVNEMTPGGNLIAAYSTLCNSTEDSIIEIDRKTGEILKHVDVGTLLDNAKRSFRDWIHINTVSYNPEDHTVLVNSRNLHTTLQINWDTGTVDWVLGNPKFWKGTTTEKMLLTLTDPDMPWFFQAHSAYYIPANLDGNPDTKHLIIFDNHWQKRTPVSFFDKERTGSYGKIYCINQKERTVSYVKEFEVLKSAIRSNAIWTQSPKHVFVMSAYLVETTEDGCDGMIYEYDYLTGELYNQYGTFHSFFRAYQFEPEIEKACVPMDYANRNPELGQSRMPAPMVDRLITNVKRLPRSAETVTQDDSINNETISEAPVRRLRQELRIKQYKDAGGKRKLAPEELEKWLCQIDSRLRGNFLFIRCRDHFISRIYFIGSQHSYQQDYTNTYQALEAIFGDRSYNIVISMKNFQKDSYKIYLDICDTIYETDWHFSLS